MRTRHAFDYSSFAWRGLLAGKDTENGYKTMFKDKEVHINSAIYGYDNVTNSIVARMKQWGFTPEQMILVVEGRSSKSPRHAIDMGYKPGDDRAPEAYEEFTILRDHMIEIWRNLGATVMIQDCAEGDDVLGWLAQETEENLVIHTFDGDLTVLNCDKNAHGAKVECHIGDLIGVNKYAVVDVERMFDHSLVTTYKALVGDSSDKIPGIKGFGAKSFAKLLDNFGEDGVAELQSMLEKGSLDELHGLVEDETDAKRKALLKQLVDHEETVIRCYKLAKIYPRWVNTLKDPIQILPGMCMPQPSGDKAEDADPRLAQWYGQRALVTADNFDQQLAHLKLHMKKTFGPAFDIESSASEESDEWLERQGKSPLDAVDALGHELTGFSITYGDNHQYTMYVSVDHAQTRNVTKVQARLLIEQLQNSVIHNMGFELPVIYQTADEDGTLWRDHWRDNSYRGFMPAVLDTMLEASYVNENIKRGLKLRSKQYLGYEQATFEQTTRQTGPKGTLLRGGRLVTEFEEVVSPEYEGGPAPTMLFETRQYKMRELPATHVFDYGCDDTICTAALHNYHRLVMSLEHSWKVYLQVEIDAAYQHAKNFIDGMPYSLQRSKELEKADDEVFAKSWAVVREYLVEQGWAGTVPPVFLCEKPDEAIPEGSNIYVLDAKGIKYAYRIVNDLIEGGFSVAEESDDDEAPAVEETEAEDDGKDPFASTRVRKVSSLIELLRKLGHETFAGMVEKGLSGPEGALAFTSWVNEHFKGEPLFKFSNKQMANLLYDVMELPVKVRGKVTATMRQKGIRVGNPAGNELAIQYALRDGDERIKEVLESLRLMRMVSTRRSLYYTKYPNFVHWKTGRIHGSHNQSHTNTRRASESAPNKQQLPKHPKIEGQKPLFREVVVPHKPGAVIVSLDFDSQELRVIAEYSRDDNLVACYVGDDLKGQHALTGVGILHYRRPDLKHIDYDQFMAILEDKKHELHALIKECRTLGKKVNFTTEYGAMAPKLAATLLVNEEDAQAFIDAREAAFPRSAEWKLEVIQEAKRKGYVTTMMGARRHLRDALRDPDGWIKLKAERQAVNFKIQGSSAEMTKMAEGRVWQDALTFDFDAICIGPIHDELVFSVMVDDLFDFLPRAHACMTAPYGHMDLVPIESSISFGPDFCNQIEIGLRPTREAVTEGITQLREMQAA